MTQQHSQCDRPLEGLVLQDRLSVVGVSLEDLKFREFWEVLGDSRGIIERDQSSVDELQARYLLENNDRSAISDVLLQSFAPSALRW